MVWGMKLLLKSNYFINDFVLDIKDRLEMLVEGEDILLGATNIEGYFHNICILEDLKRLVRTQPSDSEVTEDVCEIVADKLYEEFFEVMAKKSRN